MKLNHGSKSHFLQPETEIGTYSGALKNRGKFYVKTQRAIFSSHSFVKTRLLKMSDKIIAKMCDEKIVENHKIVTVEHELQIKGQVF